MRNGSTLMELVLALAVLAMALGITLESLVSVNSFGGFHARQSDLDEQLRRVSDRLHADLANTAWFVQYNSHTKRQERILPRVVRSDPDGFGDELHYLRLRSEHTLGPTPDDSRVAAVDFAREAPTPMDQFARAHGVRSLLLNPGWTVGGKTADAEKKKTDEKNTPFAVPAWESAGLIDFTASQDLDHVRQYRLIVRPDLEVTGRGVLLREYRDGNQGRWISDERIADNLVSFTVLTNRELPTLHANQLMISLTVQADDLQTGEARERRKQTLIIAMRSAFNE